MFIEDFAAMPGPIAMDREEESIIVLSDDEDDAVIVISSDEDEDCLGSLRLSDSHSFKVKLEPDESGDSCRVESFQLESDSDSDLPDVDIGFAAEEPPSKLQKLEIHTISQDKETAGNLCLENMPVEGIEQDRSLHEKQSTVLLTEIRKSLHEEPVHRDKKEPQESVPEKITSSGSPKKDESAGVFPSIHSIKKNIFKLLLLGSLPGKRPACAMNPETPCYNLHHQQSVPTSVSVQMTTMLETMLENENLQHFALRAMMKTINNDKYLGSGITNLLIEYLLGSEEKMELPPIEDLYLGVAILNKILWLHPPCKQGMRQYYSQICKKWFPILLGRINDLLKCENSVIVGEYFSEQTRPFEKLTPSVLPKDELYDFRDILYKKKQDKISRFRQETSQMKMHRCIVMLKFFTEVYKVSTMTWFVKHWNIKFPAFRNDVKPLLIDLAWASKSELGDVNTVVKQVFDVYCKTSCIELQEQISLIIGMWGCIIHRSEKSAFPEMGQISRNYAHKLSLCIKNSSDFERRLCGLCPEWLKFLVLCYLLNIEEPFNFYKMKEKILQIISLNCQEVNSKPYICKEVFCRNSIKSMCGMLCLKSSVIHTAIIEDIEDEDDLWFKDCLNEDSLKRNLQSLVSLLSHPRIRGQKTFFFDGFELNC